MLVLFLMCGGSFQHPPYVRSCGWRMAVSSRPGAAEGDPVTKLKQKNKTRKQVISGGWGGCFVSVFLFLFIKYKYEVTERSNSAITREPNSETEGLKGRFFFLSWV